MSHASVTTVDPAAMAAAGGGARSRPARPGIRNGTVLVYIGLTLAALVPGLWLRAGFVIPGPDWVAAALGALADALADIRFGSGVRFWLGVGGATMMGLLLFYPLRKALAARRGVGSVGGWFHAHILLGLAGPLAILYHCNFGLGGFNANMALWAMLAIVASGIAGQFVYGRVSADFYASRQRAHAHRDAILGALSNPDQSQPAKAKLLGELEIFEAELFTPRPGLVAGIWARWRVEQSRSALIDNIEWHVRERARQQGLGPHERHDLYVLVGKHVSAYFRIARAAASQSVREQLWARWRLLHLPVFLVMTVATVLHVIAVWGMDDTAGSAELTKAETAAETRIAAAGDPGATLAVASEQAEAPPAAVPTPAEATTQAAPPAVAPEMPAAETVAAVPPPGRAPVGAPVLIAGPQPVIRTRRIDTSFAIGPVTTGPITTGPVTTGPVTTAPVMTGPMTGTSAAPPPPKPAAIAVVPRAEEAPRKPAREPVKGERVDARPAPATPAAAAPAAATPASVAMAPASMAPADMKPVYSELLRRIEEQPMGLGAPKPRTLAEQIADYKALQKSGQFSHSLAETGFALTGRHLKATCADCHTRPLQETRQSNTRQCIACHKKDDVHKGRRPDCARCHTANRWSEIIRRR